MGNSQQDNRYLKSPSMKIILKEYPGHLTTVLIMTLYRYFNRFFLLQVLIETAKKLGLRCHSKGTVVTIEGPRFSSRAESFMFRTWGADVINMTTVPEVVLAKEAGICYASIAMATDYDCWKEHEEAVSVDRVLKTLKENANKAKSLLLTTIPQIGSMEWSETLHNLKNMAQFSVLLPRH
nr:S-methyl-5'-thioadenosine phosphorylase-like [Neomonachus schauinslandi]